MGYPKIRSAQQESAPTSSVTGQPYEYGIYPLKEYDRIVFLGASITAACIKGYEAAMQREIKRRTGRDIIITAIATGGNLVDDNLAAWNAAKATYTGTNTLVVTHNSGDYNSLAPYSGATKADLDAYEANYRALVDSIVGNGNEVMIVAGTFRNYNGTTYSNEQAGSLPFIQNIVMPIIAESVPCMTYGDGVAYCAPYEFTRNTCRLLDSQNGQLFQAGDGIHYTQFGYAYMRKFLLNCAINRMFGLAPVTVARIEDVDKQKTKPTDFMLMIGATTTESQEVLGAWSLDYNSTSLDANVPVPAISGTDISCLEIDWIGINTSINGYISNSNEFVTGDISPTVTNDLIKDRCYYSRIAAWQTPVVFKNLPAGTKIEFEISAYRNTSATIYVTQYSVDGGNTFVTLDPSLNNTRRHTVKIVGVADSNGEIAFMLRPDPATVSQSTPRAVFNGIKGKVL